MPRNIRSTCRDNEFWYLSFFKSSWKDILVTRVKKITTTKKGLLAFLGEKHQWHKDCRGMYLEVLLSKNRQKEIGEFSCWLRRCLRWANELTGQTGTPWKLMRAHRLLHEVFSSQWTMCQHHFGREVCCRCFRTRVTSAGVGSLVSDKAALHLHP